MEYPLGLETGCWEKINNHRTQTEERVFLSCYKQVFNEIGSEDYFLLHCRHPPLKLQR